MKKMSRDDMISYLAVLIIVVSMASIGMKLTGYANVTDTAKVNVTIDTSAAINFTVDYLDFGNGTVDPGKSGARLQTNDTGLKLDGSWSIVTDNLTLENVGNTNLTLEFKADNDADSFLGGSNPEFNYMVTEDETDACNVGSGSIDLADGTTFRQMNTTNFTICSEFPFENSKDEVAVDIELYIPDDSFIGSRVATITAIGRF